METTNIELTLSQYSGNIYCRLYDKKLGKNVAKIETHDLMDYLNSKIQKKQFKIAEKGKGNILAVLTLTK